MNEVTMIQMSIAELRSFVENIVKDVLDNKSKYLQPEKPIKGMQELATFLGVSISTAMKLKKSGIIPFFQSCRLVLFDPAKVREAMANYKPHSKRASRIDLSKIK